MRARGALTLFWLALAAGVAGCTSPYQQALDDPVLQRPDPPPTPADLRAVEPYENSPYFRD
ncbi:MAG TPA: hypothetical protein VL974_09285 [Magnetospirillum sp.]|jgi:hypothetical protein|nr:hypothetical protein [Magnetospirillum sp.]